MLFNPALYTISHIMKALGYSVESGRMRVPSAEQLIGKVIVVGGIKMGEQTDKKDPSKKYPPKFEPKSFFGEAIWTGQGGVASGKAAAGKSSLLS